MTNRNAENVKLILCLGAALSFIVATVMLYSWVTYKGIPPRELLKAASGQVSWVTYDKYSITFQLNGNSQEFKYSKIGRGVDLVYKTLSSTGFEVIVLFDPTNVSGPVFSDKKFNDVYELSISNKSLRSYEQINDAWSSNERMGAWAGFIFIFSGLFQLIYDLRYKPSIPKITAM